MRTAILLTMALLGGCVGSADNDVEPAATIDDAPAATDEAAREAPTEAPAKPTQESAGAPPAGAEGAASPPAPRAQSYAWDSSLPTSACVPAAPNGCISPMAIDGWWDRPTLEGAPLHAKLDLAWTAEPGGIASMQFGLVRAAPCEGDGCWSGEAILFTEGASPLTLDVDVPPLEAEEFLVVIARAASPFPQPVYGWAHAEQPFSVSGTFTVQP